MRNTPYTICDSNQFQKLEATSVPSLTVRAGDSIWQYGDNTKFYAKSPNNKNFEHKETFNELCGNIIAEILAIPYRPVSAIKTVDGFYIASEIDLNYNTTLNYKMSQGATLAITRDTKISDFIIRSFLCDTDSNDQSILVHKDNTNVSRIDFAYCFGYNGNEYQSTASCQPGPYFKEVKQYDFGTITTSDIFQKISTLNIPDIDNKFTQVIDEICREDFWPGKKDELLEIKDKIILPMIRFRKLEIINIIKEQLKK